MEKSKVKILIIFLLCTLFAQVAFAQTEDPFEGCGNGVIKSPVTNLFCDGGHGCDSGGLFNVVTGLLCSDNGGHGNGSGPSGSGGSGSTPTPIQSNLVVKTDDATDVTNTTATLRGSGGDKSASPSSEVTAYFRYSAQKVPPVFCNDIYGANMISTGDINLGNTTGLKSFSQKISNLTPDTTYYYCAVISNKTNIAYGDQKISSPSTIAYGDQGKVKSFHTNCYTTTVNTLDATNIQSTSVNLKGSYCSTKTAVTSFEYTTIGGNDPTLTWKKVGETTHNIGSNSNVYGNFDFVLTGISPSTKYQFKAVAVNGSGATTQKFEGLILNFTTGAGATTSGGGSANNNSISGGNGSNSSNNTGGSVGGIPSGSGGNNSSNNSSSGNTSSGNSGNGGGNSTNFYGSGNSGNNNYTPTPIADLKLGVTATPPDLAIVRYHEGVETVLTRQIVANPNLAKSYGYVEGSNLQNFANYLADQLARMFGYVSTNGTEIRVQPPDVAAYQLVQTGNSLTIYEYYNGVVVNIRNSSETLKTASGYEYYFKK